MSDEEEAKLVEELARILRAAPKDFKAEEVARTLLAPIQAREAAAKEQEERLAEALLEVVGCFEAAIVEGWQDKCHELSTEPGEIGDLVVRRINWAYGAASDALAAWEESRG